MSDGRIAVTGGNGKLGRTIVSDLSKSAEVCSLDLVPGPSGVKSRYVDILSLENMQDAFQRQDVVVHIAALLQPDDPIDKLFQVNVVGTWNVLEAAREANVRKVVLISSECASGIINISGVQKAMPEYLPIDEDHPLRPAEAYGLSKQLNEMTGQSFARQGPMQVVVLRPTLVLAPGMEGFVRRTRERDDPDLWSYVELSDVVQAVRLAVAYEGPKFDVFYLSARDTFSPEETLRFMERKFGCLPKIRKPELYEENPYAAIWDLSRAETRLGLKPQSDWRKFLSCDHADFQNRDLGRMELRQ